MSQSEDDEGRHLSPSSEEKEYTRSSPFALEPSETDVTSEVDIEGCSQDSQESSQTEFKVALSLKNGTAGTQEPSKLGLDFEDAGQKKYVGVKINLSSETLCNEELKNEVCCPEDGEVTEADEISADLEEGEIQDSANEKSADTFTCRYYQMGSCLYGKDCRFFHVSDKGLYSMLDLPISVKSVHQPTQFVEKKSSFIPPVSEDIETAWDRALKEAKNRIESKKKVALGRDNLRMTVQSVDYIDKRFTPKESPKKSSYRQTFDLEGRGSSLSKRKTGYEVAAAKPKSFSRYRFDFKRSKTPRNMRWSPKSVSSSSRSRSCSRSSYERRSCSCSSTPSSKRGRRILAYRVKTRSWKRYASSSSESCSMSSVSKKRSKLIKGRRRESRSRQTSSTISGRRGPSKIPLPKRFERKSSDRLSRRDVPRRSIQPKLQGTSKPTSSYSKTCIRSCSDMSISPLSDSSNRKGDHFVICCSSDRNVSDMSISPLSDDSSRSRFSCRNEGNGYSVSKSKVEKFKEDIVQTGSFKDRELTKSCLRKNITGEKPLCCKSDLNSTSVTKVRDNDPLLMDLMKFHGNFRRGGSLGGVKIVPKETRVKMAASKLADKSTDLNAMNKVKQQGSIMKSNLSKKEILLKRLQDINAAIERKHTLQRFKK